MDRKTIGIVLLIAGALVFLWATSQISNLPPAMLTPYALQEKLIQGPRGMYRLLQLAGALAAIGGGVLLFLKKPGS